MGSAPSCGELLDAGSCVTGAVCETVGDTCSAIAPVSGGVVCSEVSRVCTASVGNGSCSAEAVRSAVVVCSAIGASLGVRWESSAKRRGLLDVGVRERPRLDGWSDSSPNRRRRTSSSDVCCRCWCVGLSMFTCMLVVVVAWIFCCMFCCVFCCVSVVIGRCDGVEGAACVVGSGVAGTIIDGVGGGGNAM